MHLCVVLCCATWPRSRRSRQGAVRSAGSRRRHRDGHCRATTCSRVWTALPCSPCSPRTVFKLLYFNVFYLLHLLMSESLSKYQRGVVSYAEPGTLKEREPEQQLPAVRHRGVVCSGVSYTPQQAQALHTTRTPGRAPTTGSGSCIAAHAAESCTHQHTHIFTQIEAPSASSTNPERPRFSKAARRAHTPATVTSPTHKHALSLGTRPYPQVRRHGHKLVNEGV
jgi:hypothetical protein